MGKEELFESLEKLKAEIESIAGADDSVKEKLAALVADAITQVDGSKETSETDKEEQTLSEKITDLVGEFETEHPQLTEMIYRITMRLSDLGI